MTSVEHYALQLLVLQTLLNPLSMMNTIFVTIMMSCWFFKLTFMLKTQELSKRVDLVANLCQPKHISRLQEVKKYTISIPCDFLWILGFFSSHLVGKYIIPASLAPPISQGISIYIYICIENSDGSPSNN